MELSSHACIQRRAEKDSVANEAGSAATIGSSISNSTFKTFADGMEKLEADLREQSANPDDIQKIKDIASTLGEDFWICQNLSSYNKHRIISQGGYYEERRACGDPYCCGTRILKPSLRRINHYEDPREVERHLNEEELK